MTNIVAGKPARAAAMLLLSSLVLGCFTSCEVYKRRYRDGFYFVRVSHRTVEKTLAETNLQHKRTVQDEKTTRVNTLPPPGQVVTASASNYQRLSASPKIDVRRPPRSQVSSRVYRVAKYGVQANKGNWEEGACASCGSANSLKCLIGTYFTYVSLSVLFVGLLFVLVPLITATSFELLTLGIIFLLMGIIGVLIFSKWC